MQAGASTHGHALLFFVNQNKRGRMRSPARSRAQCELDGRGRQLEMHGGNDSQNFSYS